VHQPGYLLLDRKELKERVEVANRHLTECRLCPRECGTGRASGKGFCQAGAELKVSSFGPHFGEEKVLVGKFGSGTIFFAFCNMSCIFCQNHELSFGGRGKAVSDEDLASYMLKLQNDYRCHNINLVTPTHFVPNIIKALSLAAKKGLRLPLVYNCGGYEELDTLALLNGLIDIYMPDFKYNLPEWGQQYSKIKNYPQKAQIALQEMDKQVGGLKVDEQGAAFRGLIIRHLILPGGLENTKKVLDFIKEKLSPDCLVNLMDQYYPAHQAFRYPELSRRLTGREYAEAYRYAQKLGIRLA